MKNKTKQQNHTEGKLRTTHFDATCVVGSTQNSRDYQLPIIVNNVGLVATAYGATAREAVSNAKRIVKAGNMYDELVDHLKKLHNEYVYSLNNQARVLGLTQDKTEKLIQENSLVVKTLELLNQAEGE